MANIVKNVKGLGPVEGTKETVRDLFGKGKHAVSATFKVTDDNGDVQEVSNAEATPIYKTPTGYSNTRSYAYLTQGDNGKMTLNVSKDLLESDSFKKNYLENSTFREVLNMYNANKNANTVIATTDAEGNVKNQTLQELVDGYNTALGEFASLYEGYSLMRDNIKNNTGFDFSDDEIRLAANSISEEDKNKDTGVIFLPDDWLNIYDFTKLSSYDPETKSISTKDFFDVYNLDKDGGISENQWRELKASAEGIISGAYSGNMKRNIEEDTGGDAEVTAKAKDRLARAIQANNLLSTYDPEQSYLRTVGIVAGNTLLNFVNKNFQFLNKVDENIALSAEGWHIMFDYGVASIKDASEARTVIAGATYEDLADGSVTPANYREYINGILISATDGSQSEVDRVTAEWNAKVAASDTVSQAFGSPDNVLNKFDEYVKWYQSYTAEIAPKAAKTGKIMGELIFLAEEVYFANKLGEFVDKSIYPAQNTYSALFNAYKNGTSVSARLGVLYNIAIRKPLAFAANMSTQAVVDTLAFEDRETFLAAWQRMDPGAQKALTNAFAENFEGNVLAEVVGLGSSAVGGWIATSDNAAAKWVNARAIKAANAVSIPKKKMQVKFAESKLGQFLQKPIGKGARSKADLAFRIAKEEFGDVIKAQTLEEWNIEKAKVELEATKNIVGAKSGAEYVTDFETKATKIAETTTEAILGKASEKTNFLNQASRIAEGIKTYKEEILADPSIRNAFKDVTDTAAEMQKVLKWADYNPAAFRFMSQDSANYVVNKNHYDNLLAKRDMLKATGEELDPKKAARLSELEEWLRNFRATHSEEAISALNDMVAAQQRVNKTMTDWQVKHNIMSSGKYQRMIDSGMFGASDEKYIRAIAMPEGKTMYQSTEEEVKALRRKFEDRLADDTGFYTGTRDVDYTFDEDFNLSGNIADNYLDPILVNNLTLEAMAKAYQGKMWYNSLTSIKAPVRVIDMEGKPATKGEVNKVISKAKSSAAEAINKLKSEDLLGNTGETMGLAYRDSRLENYHKTGKPTNKVEDAKAKLDKILGVDSDAKVYTNVGTLDLDQTKSVISTFGADAPNYGKVKTNAELKAQFETLSAKQQEQALEAIGKKPIEKAKRVQGKIDNPNYETELKEWKAEKDAHDASVKAWNEEKAAYDAEYKAWKEQKKAYDDNYNAWKKEKAAYDKAQKKAAKASETIDESKVYDSLYEDLNDASISLYRFDAKDAQPLDKKDAEKAVSESRKNELEEFFKVPFNEEEFKKDVRKFINDTESMKTNSKEFKEAKKALVDKYIDPDYSKEAKAKAGVGEIAEEAKKIVDGHDFRTERVSDGYQKFLHDNTSIKTHGDSEPISKAANIAAEQIVTPGGFVDDINQELRSGKLDIGKVGDETSEEWSRLLDHYINPDTVALNYYGDADILADEFADSYEASENALANMYRELTDRKPLEFGVELNIDERYKIYSAIKEKLDDKVMDALRTGNRELSEDTILYRVLSDEGNFVGKGDMSWLNKDKGEYLDKGFGFVTLDENKVLNSVTLTNPKGNKYVLRIHAPKGTGIFGFDGSVIVESNRGAMMFSGVNAVASSGHRAGGELVLPPNQKGKFVKSGEKIGDAEYVDVYLNGWTKTLRPEPEKFNISEPAKFDKPKPGKFDKKAPLKRIDGEKLDVKKIYVKAIDQPNAMRAWNKAVTDTMMVEDLNKTFIRERINPAEGGPAKMSNTTRELLENYIADNTIKTFEFNIDTTKDIDLEKLGAAKVKADEKLAKFNAALDEYQYAKAMEIASEEGWDPFSLATKDLADSVIDYGVTKLNGNLIAEKLKAAGEEYGFADDTVLRYYTLSGMVEVKSDGTVGLNSQFKKAFKDRYSKRFDAAIRAEGDLTSGERTNLLKEAVEKMDDYVSQQWRQAQRELIDAGATELVDTDKMYDAIRGEMSNIVDQNRNNRCIVQILDNDGKYKFVELDPLIADLYRSRPYVRRGEDSFIRKISRWSRLGNVTLNPKSWINQTFKDPLISMIMAGWGHSITRYQNEMAEMFGERFVEYLQKSMTEAGWTEFSKGLSDKELAMKAVKTMTTGEYGAGAYAEGATQRELFRANANKGETSAIDVFGAAAAAREQLGRGYSKSRAAAAKKGATDKLYEFFDTKTPGSIYNNWREAYFRKANYTAAFNDALKRGSTIEQARSIAELVSRNATTNFQNTFMWGNWLCNDVPFLSAAINGSASFWRLFEMDPVGIMTRFNASALYLMAQTINSGQTVEDRKKLAAVPDSVKNSNMVIIYEGEVLTIPLPEEVARLLAPFRQAAEKMLGSENRSWVELLYNDALNISPINLDGFSTEDQTALTKNEGMISRLSREAEVLLSQCSPPIVETAIMAITGKDPYTGSSIDKSYTYFDEEGNMQTMDYNKTELAAFISEKLKDVNVNISASMAEKLFENLFGTGFMWMVEDLYSVFQALSDKSLKPIERVAKSSGESLIANPITVSEYEMLDQYDKDFKSIMKSLEKQKNSLLAPDGNYSKLISRLRSLDSSADNYETQKKNLIKQGLQMQEDFRKSALNLVNTYVNHYGSNYDGRKFAAVLSLLNFNSPTMLPITAKDFQQENDAYYRGRQAAQQTMIDLGFSSTNDYSILGVSKRNAQTGEVYVKFYSPTAILNASNSVFNNMAEGVNAEIAAALDVADINRNEMFKGYYAAKAQGSAAAKQYKKDWNAKVVNAIAPIVNQYGAGTVLSNYQVKDFLDNYLFISNPYKTEDYLKDIFEVKE